MKTAKECHHSPELNIIYIIFMTLQGVQLIVGPPRYIIIPFPCIPHLSSNTKQYSNHCKNINNLSDYRPTKSKVNPIQTEKSGTRKLDKEQCETS
jgi:hypothetical protein